jgi:hypothetical protein
MRYLVDTRSALRLLQKEKRSAAKDLGKGSDGSESVGSLFSVSDFEPHPTSTAPMQVPCTAHASTSHQSTSPPSPLPAQSHSRDNNKDNYRSSNSRSNSTNNSPSNSAKWSQNKPTPTLPKPPLAGMHLNLSLLTSSSSSAESIHVPSSLSSQKQQQGSSGEFILQHRESQGKQQRTIGSARALTSSSNNAMMLDLGETNVLTKKEEELIAYAAALPPTIVPRMLGECDLFIVSRRDFHCLFWVFYFCISGLFLYFVFFC